MKIEKTLVLIKPDGVMRNLVGEIISRFEKSGMKIAGMKMIWAEDKKAQEHYRKDIAEKYGEKIRKNLIEYIKEGPIIALVLQGVDSIKVTRKIVGSTYPNESLPGTIRGDFAHISKDYANAKEINVKNLIHASSDKKDAETEIPIWFNKKEMHEYKTLHDLINL
ncbi:nucleoside-diphosphate kinase [Candidatus Parvarchaeota archaeon]|nr:MAG: nucleoside-diphosphate kinase [Candidatus Parvarchaeota archaeon]